MAYLSMNSPIGSITLFEDDGAIVALEWGKGDSSNLQRKTNLLLNAKNQLNEYFDAKRKKFDLPLAPMGSTYQKKIWFYLKQIQYGNTKTYKEIAIIANSSPRAVGNACGQNPIPIIIPCHRVIKTNGELGGFSAIGGIKTKNYLLCLEKV
ncbi:MAG: methylated-DNA--[protein]-cysteine S-methyltransferase [Pseudomonadota bacterium]|nr:methylated-DNA--[protein]-cysteine S-methyltransferase [Pseudomonadota bacterium]